MFTSDPKMFFLNIFSVDVGPIHLLGLSTEYHGFFYEYGIQAVMAQNEWIRNDLKVLVSWLYFPYFLRNFRQPMPIVTKFHGYLHINIALFTAPIKIHMNVEHLRIVW